MKSTSMLLTKEVFKFRMQLIIFLDNCVCLHTVYMDREHILIMACFYSLYINATLNFCVFNNPILNLAYKTITRLLLIFIHSIHCQTLEVYIGNSKFPRSQQLRKVLQLIPTGQDLNEKFTNQEGTIKNICNDMNKNLLKNYAWQFCKN